VIETWWERYCERRNATSSDIGASEADATALESFRWSLEELAVSLFAQELKTPFPVSAKRLEKVWAELCR
jgi:ATP-dependent helicase HrpA